MSTQPVLTLQQLEERMATAPKQFWFIRCLHPDDMVIFKQKYVNYLNRYAATDPVLFDALQECGIPLYAWVYLMSYCSPLFHKQYYVYRKAYKGEHEGSNVICTEKDDYWAIVKVYGNADRRPINILITENSICNAKVVRESSYVNNAVVFWNDNNDILN